MFSDNAKTRSKSVDSNSSGSEQSIYVKVDKFNDTYSAVNLKAPFIRSTKNSSGLLKQVDVINKRI